MNVLRISRPGPPEVLTMGEMPTPEPGPSQVRVKIHAAGVNRADLLQRRGLYPAPPGSPPDVPGLEFAGVVEVRGPGALQWEVGDRVMGLCPGGGYAQALTCHERELLPVPPQLSFAQAAALPEAFITAWDAAFLQAQLRPCETLLIHAVASGVGTAAAQLGALHRCQVLGTSRSEAKLDQVAGLPPAGRILVGGGSFAREVLERTGGRGADVILDLVGGAYVAEDIQAAAPQGRIVVVGLMAGAQAPLPLDRLLTRRITLKGTVLRGRPLEEKIALVQAFGRQVLPLFMSGELTPVLEGVAPFREAPQVHQRLESNATVGKWVLSWEE